MPTEEKPPELSIGLFPSILYMCACEVSLILRLVFHSFSYLILCLEFKSFFKILSVFYLGRDSSVGQFVDQPK